MHGIKIQLYLLALGLVLLLAACQAAPEIKESGGRESSSTPQVDITTTAGIAPETKLSQTTAQSTGAEEGIYDLDLTGMGSSLVYANVYDMMMNPSKYLGKHIRIRGNFATASVGDVVYFACIIPDATACCSQGLEFVLAKERAYPAEYPKEGTEITISGIFDIYYEGNQAYFHLRDAEMQE